MRVSEVKAGMKGHGRSVFYGSKVEQFDVEVVSVLKNFNPRRDVILIRCAGQNLEHTGSIAGMSGSPIYLIDDQGRERMIGAFAYGWSLAKDPIAGVQPIEYMLALADRPAPTTNPAPGASASPRQRYDLKPAVSLLAARQAPLLPHGGRGAGLESTRLRPLSTPVSVGGISESLLEKLSPIFASQNLALLRSGAAGGTDDASEPPPLEPGSVVVTPLLTGDVQFHANGTVTEVLGNHVFAFGHPFNNEGPVDLPMAAGRVDAVIASIESSFKMATMGKLIGTIYTDETVGIAGKLGPAPASVPIDITVEHASRVDKFHFDAIRHPRLLPTLAAIALDSSIVGDSALPQYNTVEYDLNLAFENGESIRIENVDVNVDPMALVFQIAMPVMAAAENPFERVLLKQISGTIRVTPEVRDAQILAVQLPKTRFRPSDTITGFITTRPFRGDEANTPFSLALPSSLPDGQYQLVVGDWERFLNDELSAKPFQFTAENVNEVFQVSRDVTAVRHDEVFIRLLRQPDGVAVGRVAMNQLPSSRRQVLLGAGRSNVSAFVSSDVKRLKTGRVMTGSAEFTIEIENKTKVESGTPTTKPAG